MCIGRYMDDKFYLIIRTLQASLGDSSKQIKPLSPDKAANGLSSINQCKILKFSNSWHEILSAFYV